jgi:hypothetical protein
MSPGCSGSSVGREPPGDQVAVKRVVERLAKFVTGHRFEAAAITLDDGPNGKVSNADIVKQLEEESKSRAWLPVTMAT